MKLTTGKRSRPRNVLLYGQHGSGKTTLAATFPKPLILDIEGGSDDIDVSRTERLKDYADIQSAISWLITAENDFSTVVIDSTDWMEALVKAHVAASYDESSIEGTSKGSPLGFGKGYKYTAESFEHFVTGFRKLNELGKAVVLICHAKTIKYSPPDGDSYDRIVPDLHDRVASLLMEFCDEVLYLTKKTFTRTEELGFNRERKIAIVANDRVLVTSDTSAICAKNRLGMPQEIPATFADYASFISRPSLGDALVEMVNNTPTPAGNIAGQIRDGSSKTKQTN